VDFRCIQDAIYGAYTIRGVMKALEWYNICQMERVQDVMSAKRLTPVVESVGKVIFHKFDINKIK
jgi:hypothetical protein